MALVRAQDGTDADDDTSVAWRETLLANFCKCKWVKAKPKNQKFIHKANRKYRNRLRATSLIPVFSLAFSMLANGLLTLVHLHWAHQSHLWQVRMAGRSSADSYGWQTIPIPWRKTKNFLLKYQLLEIQGAATANNVSPHTMERTPTGSALLGHVLSKTVPVQWPPKRFWWSWINSPHELLRIRFDPLPCW